MEKKKVIKKITKSNKKKKIIKKPRKTQAQKDRENALYDINHGYYDGTDDDDSYNEEGGYLNYDDC